MFFDDGSYVNGVERCCVFDVRAKPAVAVRTLEFVSSILLDLVFEVFRFVGGE